MRLHSYILLLILFSGFSIASGQEKGKKNTFRYSNVAEKYTEFFKTQKGSNNQLLQNTKNADEGLLLQKNNSKTSATPTRERIAGFTLLSFIPLLTDRQTFPAVVFFHTYTTLLADFKNCLLYPKHSFW